ncbi:FecR domain-containing protein [Siphonobacter sp. SORGH_AS_0500]|uniref:FecR family protein n=1 Tax=Siphonobacter sp. SORGH_AS_0500 TaxID=1864824 RepID=UPI00285D8D38|nr:FecR domain-containing protein [Siphonobacter sp. SORGH_AS_0500]MDR6197171.1 transmembrane sensor [Siphonobacter sp. SORGH_AS_0500]
MSKYNTYSTEDFLNDTDFIRWVKERSGADEQSWAEWLRTNPVNREEFEKATRLLEIIVSVKRMEPGEVFRDQLLRDINTSIGQEERRGLVIRWSKRVGAGLAASLAILGGIGWYAQSMITIRTDYAQHKKVTLPDESVVTLNANSSISYHRAWRWKSVREVWVNGEAFLEVNHLNKDPKQIRRQDQFQVHANQLTIEVLGTKFNVKERRNQVLVALLEGKISVRDSRQTLLMKPGEVVHYDGQLKKQNIRQVQSVPQAWLEGNMVVNGLTARQIIDNFEDTYGYRVILEDSTLASKQIDGTIAFGSEETILYTLSNILNVNIYKNGNTITLRSR